jgi:hypothetical protein
MISIMESEVVESRKEVKSLKEEIKAKKLFGRLMISIMESEVVESRKEVKSLKEEIKAKKTRNQG